jgi:amino acid transporter
MKNNERNNQKIIIILLVVLLSLAVIYIAYIQIYGYQLRKQINAYNEGAEYGFQQALTILLQEVSTCKEVPLNVDGQTVHIVAIECFMDNSNQQQMSQEEQIFYDETD